MPPTAPKPQAAKSRNTRKAVSSEDRPQFKFRIRVMRGSTIAVGPGKIDLLLAVQEQQSISAAAKSLGMSYRRAWMLVDEMNRSLKEPVVSTAAGGSHGGGTALTEFGLELVALYRGIEARAQEACKDDIRRLLSIVGG